MRGPFESGGRNDDPSEDHLTESTCRTAATLGSRYSRSPRSTSIRASWASMAARRPLDPRPAASAGGGPDGSARAIRPRRPDVGDRVAVQGVEPILDRSDPGGQAVDVLDEAAPGRGTTRSHRRRPDRRWAACRRRPPVHRPRGPGPSGSPARPVPGPAGPRTGSAFGRRGCRGPPRHRRSRRGTAARFGCVPRRWSAAPAAGGRRAPPAPAGRAASARRPCGRSGWSGCRRRRGRSRARPLDLSASNVSSTVRSS